MHELPRTINGFKRLGIRTRNEGLYQYLREIKATVDSLQNEQSELICFKFQMVDEDKEIFMLIILNLKLKRIYTGKKIGKLFWARMK